MTQLIIDGQDIDLYDSDPINLKYQFTDVNNIQSSTGSFSQTFRIPATANNYAVFGDMASPNDTVFNPKVKVSAIISVDTLPVMRGHVQFKRAYIIDGQHDEYEIVFFGEAVNLSRTIGEKKLRDIDLSALDHVVSSPNLTLSWGGALFSGNIRYGLIDKGNVWANQGNGNAITINNPLYAGSFTPFVNLRYLLKELFTQNGFTVVSTFFNAEADYYVPYHNGKNYVIPEGTLEELQFTAGLSADNVITGSGVHALVNWNDTTAPFYDVAGVFNAANGRFTAPFAGSYVFLVALTITNTNTSFSYVQVRLRRVADGVTIYQSTPQILAPFGTIFMFENTSVDLTAQDYDITLLFTGSPTDQWTVEAAFSTSPQGGGSFWVLAPTTEPLYGQNCIVSNNAPDMKQMDFLRSLQTMFNLVFVPDSNDPTIITVEPFNTYMAAGAVKDYTEDLDTSTDIVIYPTTDLQSKNYEWTYKADGDILNQSYVKTADRVYGRYLIEEADNDFAVGDKKIECKFGAYPVNAITGTTILIHKSYTDSGAIVTKPLCKVVIWGGLQAGSYAYFNEVLASVSTAQTYPYFGHYNQPVPVFGGEDLNFGPEQPLHPIESNPFNNLYNTYWRAYVDQLYSASARIMEANFYLSGVDLAAFRFNDQIFVKDSYWRVLSIDYSPNSNSTSKVQLIKVLDAIRPCAIIPDSSNLDGSINFVDASGDSSPATQECCEAFGFVFTDGRCYNSFTTGGVQPDTPALATSNRSSVNSNGSGLSVLVGQEIQASFFNALAVGRAITIGGERHIALGDNITTGAQSDIVAIGAGVNAFMQGQHFGGGWNYDAFYSGQGYAQHGQFVMIYNGDFDLGDTVELFVNGLLNERINIPADASLSVKMTFAIQLVNIPMGVIISEVLEFNDLWTKYPTATTNSVGAFAPDFQRGSFGGVIECEIDTTTDTAQHRVLLTNTNVVNTQPTRVICVVRYTMATL